MHAHVERTAHRDVDGLLEDPVAPEELELLGEQAAQRRDAQRNGVLGQPGRLDEPDALLDARHAVALRVAGELDARQRAVAHVVVDLGGDRDHRSPPGAARQPRGEEARLGVAGADVRDLDVGQLRERGRVLGVVEGARDGLAPARDLRPREIRDGAGGLPLDEGRDRVESPRHGRRVDDDAGRELPAGARARPSTRRARPASSRNTGRSGRSSPATRLGSAIPPRPLESDTISEQTCTPLLSPLTGVQKTRASATTSLSSSRPSAMIAREGRLYGSDATTSTIWSACSRRSQKTTRSSMCVRTPRPLPDVSCSRRSASVASIVESVDAHGRRQRLPSRAMRSSAASGPQVPAAYRCGAPPSPLPGLEHRFDDPPALGHGVLPR